MPLGPGGATSDEGGASATQDVDPAPSAEPDHEALVRSVDDGAHGPPHPGAPSDAVGRPGRGPARPAARPGEGLLRQHGLEIEAKSIGLAPFAPGLNDAVASRTLIQRHDHWQAQLPRQARDLWSALVALDADSRAALLAVCVGRSVNALLQPWERRAGAMQHADTLAEHVGLDMVADGGWASTVESYLGRVTKARILAAVTEARGESATAAIAQLRKPEMAQAAEALLAGTGWLPISLRTPGLDHFSFAASQALAKGNDATSDSESTAVDRHLAEHAIAAE